MHYPKESRVEARRASQRLKDATNERVTNEKIHAMQRSDNMIAEYTSSIDSATTALLANMTYDTSYEYNAKEYTIDSVSLERRGNHTQDNDNNNVDALALTTIDTLILLIKQKVNADVHIAELIDRLYKIYAKEMYYDSDSTQDALIKVYEYLLSKQNDKNYLRYGIATLKTVYRNAKLDSVRKEKRQLSSASVDVAQQIIDKLTIDEIVLFNACIDNLLDSNDKEYINTHFPYELQAIKVMRKVHNVYFMTTSNRTTQEDRIIDRECFDEFVTSLHDKQLDIFNLYYIEDSNVNEALQIKRSTLSYHKSIMRKALDKAYTR